jgi:hypothetical protein
MKPLSTQQFKEIKMNINLQQDELEIAIGDYLRKTGVVNVPLTIMFTAGRKGNGVSVEITVAADASEVPLGQVDKAIEVDDANPFDMDTIIDVASDVNPFAIPATSETELSDITDFMREPQEATELTVESVQSVDAETDEEETVNVPPTNSIFD